MHNLDLILTLTGGLAAALVCGYITHRLKLSPIVGYLLAGIVVGPHTPGFIANQGLAEQFAEIGVILLLFGVGLDFHLEHLLKVRKLVVPGGVIQITWTATLTTLLTLAFGWQIEAGLVFGLSLSVASTVVMVRVLADIPQAGDDLDSIQTDLLEPAFRAQLADAAALPFGNLLVQLDELRGGLARHSSRSLLGGGGFHLMRYPPGAKFMRHRDEEPAPRRRSTRPSCPSPLA